MDARNTLRQHLIVGVFSLGLVAILRFLLDNSWTVSFARVSFILLFLILIIGPVMRLKRPAQISSPLFAPWSWRGELGIWFMIVSIIHASLVFAGRQWDVIGYMGDMRLLADRAIGIR